MRKFLTILLLIGMSLTLVSVTSQAAYQENGVPYRTYAEDYRRRLIPTQDAYIPIASYQKIGDYQLRGPEDIFIDHENRILIADTMNRRIVIVEKNMERVYSIGEGSLVRPTGVYADEKGFVYVADFDQNTVIKFDLEGNEIKRFDRPTERMFGTKTPYRPYKITVDAGQNLFVISEGTYQGLIQFNSLGEFLGFFGSNPTSPDIRTTVLRTIFSEEVVANFITINPQTMTNLSVDAQNRIFTVTRGTHGDAIKRLNVSGINRLPKDLNTSDVMSSIAVGPIGNFYTTADDGFIREYDAEGNLLFMFGGKDSRTYQKGLFNTPSGIAVDDGYHIYVVDRAKNELQVFVPTEFSNLVHSAVELYQDGDYESSMEPWENVLASNAMFDLAHKGIGHAYFKIGAYDEALDAYRIAGDRVGYSNAFWEIRNVWLIDNLSYFMIALLGFYALSLVNHRFFEKKYTKPFLNRLNQKARSVKLIDDVLYLNVMRKHPLDGIYGIKREQRIGMLTATILYFVFFLWRLIAIFYEGASFNTHDLETFSLENEFIRFMGPMILFIFANYLVCAVNDGEGRFKDVFIGTIYSFAPLLIFWPFVVLVSRGLTLNEVFIYQASMTILYGWSFILLFFMIKDIHNYNFKETIKVILITIFTIIFMILGIVLLFGLARQMYNFVLELISEVIIRG